MFNHWPIYPVSVVFHCFNHKYWKHFPLFVSLKNCHRSRNGFSLTILQNISAFGTTPQSPTYQKISLTLKVPVALLASKVGPESKKDKSNSFCFLFTKGKELTRPLLMDMRDGQGTWWSSRRPASSQPSWKHLYLEVTRSHPCLFSDGGVACTGALRWV